MILNGIENVVTRGDLADRAIFLRLDPIPEESRRAEAELRAAFEAERPHILGALLDAVVEGLKRLPDTHLPRLPPNGGFRTLGERLRDCTVGFRHLLGGLLQQSSRKHQRPR